MTTTILTPVADCSGELVWATELAAAGERPGGLICVGCGSELLLRAGEVNRPHFAHRHADACPAGETALHATTCRVLADALVSASRDGRHFPISSSCRHCNASRDGNLPAPELEVTIDSVLADRIRPDLLARAGGRDLFVIEVVVTHAPEPATLQLYRERDLPTVVVRPTWETLEQLRTGLHADLQQTEPGQVGCYEIVSRCRFPRHVGQDAGTCSTCRQPTRRLIAEVSTTRCWRRGCNTNVRVLDLYDHADGHPQLVAASCPDLPDLSSLATELKVRLEWRHSNQAQGAYLMHVCPRCKVSQGDNFLYAADGAEPSLSDPVVELTVCAGGHLDQEAPRRWPAGSRAARIISPRGAVDVVGVVGERPGLFERVPSIRVQRLDRHNVGSIVNRITGVDRM